jgi:RNA polymerase sigma factor FliA
MTPARQSNAGSAGYPGVPGSPGAGAGSVTGSASTHPSATPSTGAAPTTATSPVALIESCQGMVRTLAWSVHQRLPGQVELDDLIAYGQIGLAQAARDFSPSHGSLFSTYAWYRVRGAIIDGLAKMSWFSRHHYHARKYERMANDLLELEAIDSQKSTGFSDDASWTGSVSASLSVVYFASLDGGARSAELLAIQDTASGSPEDDAIGRETRQLVHEMIQALPAEAGELVRAVYFEGKTLQEAATRLGVSKSWASRLHAKALQRLAIAMRERGQDGPEMIED